MARSHCQLIEGAEYMVSPVQDFGAGGRGPQNVRSVLPGSSSGSPVIWHGDVGGNPTDRMDPGELPPQGEDKYGGYTTSEIDGW